MGFLGVVGEDFFKKGGWVDWAEGEVVGPVHALVGVEAIFSGGYSFVG